MLAELHCHSVYSKRIKVPHEGMDSPRDMVQHAKQLGIDVLAISDHDEFKGAQQAVKYGAQYGVMVIPAEEITTADGHMVALGISEQIAPLKSAEETIDLIHAQGGIATAPHAFDINHDGLREKARLCDAMESFNSINLDRVSNYTNLVFALQHKMPMIAGSDAHSMAMMGRGLTALPYVDSVDAALRAIRNGRTRVAKKEYQPMKVIMDWSLNRLNMSYDFVNDYINSYYRHPKKFVSCKALRLVKGYPGKMDPLFSGIAYFSLGSVFMYSILKNALGSE